ncbi:unnamed protein product [Rotaria magnacalcarata]|uniref:Uncharacterized protein n=1 Tax=Rotaria magnacalcarata TaxID=392030 RepID=A0A816PX58_9BILA|nr:unnamed protein product [Rotaria magnacalcarata]CAF2077681.1 unnamed protein product [Rotaria magnacalcarata]CAF3880720.1 unnamed protein product [Rotaria magnacalcarata]CAF3944828.1 unnamed protein product [Rotaria magnacalcarata]
MRLTVAAAICIVALALSLTTAFPTHGTARRGLIPDLSGLSGVLGGGFLPVCIFPPCNEASFLFPEIDWEALHASIAQWNQEQEQLLSQGNE